MKRITKIDGTDFIPYSKYLDLEEKYKGMLKLYSDAGEEIKKLKEELEKLHDKFMLKLAEAFLLPPTSNQIAEYKKRNFYKWYDEIKNQMRKEIKEGN